MNLDSYSPRIGSERIRNSTTKSIQWLITPTQNKMQKT